MCNSCRTHTRKHEGSTAGWATLVMLVQTSRLLPLTRTRALWVKKPFSYYCITHLNDRISLCWSFIDVLFCSQAVSCSTTLHGLYWWRIPIWVEEINMGWVISFLLPRLAKLASLNPIVRVRAEVYCVLGHPASTSPPVHYTSPWCDKSQVLFVL